MLTDWTYISYPFAIDKVSDIVSRKRLLSHVTSVLIC